MCFPGAPGELPPATAGLFPGAPGGWGAEEAGARCSVLSVMEAWPARQLGVMAGVDPVPRPSGRGFAEACGLLAFVYGDGIVEVRVKKTRVLVLARVNTPRVATLFAGALRIMVFAGSNSLGSVFCSNGMPGLNMCFKAPLDLDALRSLGLGGIAGGKAGVRGDLMRCLESSPEALYSVVAGLIDSEGHVRSKASTIEIGMKDAELLMAIYDRLYDEGFNVARVRVRGDGLAVLRLMLSSANGDKAWRLVNAIYEPDKRLLAARMLVPGWARRDSLYREMVEGVRAIAQRLRTAMYSDRAGCKECAETVKHEALALASTARWADEQGEDGPTHTSHAMHSSMRGVGSMRAQLLASEETCSLAVRFLDPLPEAVRKALERGGLARLRLRGECFSGVLYLAGRLEGDVLVAEVFPVGGECRLGASMECLVEIEELRAVGLGELWRGTRGLIPPAGGDLELLAEAGAAAAAYAGLSTWPACDEPMLWRARVDGDYLEVNGPSYARRTSGQCSRNAGKTRPRGRRTSG